MPPIVYRSYDSLFTSSAQRESLSQAFGSSPSLTVIAGPAHDLSTVGGLTAWKCLVFCATLSAVMAVTTVIRRTRADEEAGRMELLGSTPMAPSSSLSAGIDVGLSASLLVVIGTVLGLVALGSPLLGAAALGAAIGGTGIAFVGVAAVAAQVTTTSRAASSLAFTALGVAFGLRAIGDTTGLQWLDWTTPLGWAEEVAPYGDNRLWVLGLFVAMFLACRLVAATLLARRDVGSGLLAERRGPSAAGPRLSSSLGLAWRLDARWLLIWILGLSALGAVIGSVTESLASLAADNAFIATYLGSTHGSLSDLFLAQMLEMMSVLAAASGVQAVLRARREEDAGRAEVLLSTGLTRWRFLGSHLFLGVAGATSALVAAGMGMGITASLAGAQVSPVGMAGGIFVQLVPCVALVSAAAALVGCAPRISVMALPLVIATYVLNAFGDLLHLPGWILDLSVYAHVPRIPGGTPDVGSLLVVLALTTGLTGAALLGMRRRDLT